MKRNLKFMSLIAMILFVASCAATPGGPVSATETIVVSYESLAMVGFPTVKTYLAQREANGSLTGQALTDAKAEYASARAKFIQAGDMLTLSIQSPQAVNMTTYATLLNDVAILLANLSGGKVQGNQLTIPAVGGAK